MEAAIGFEPMNRGFANRCLRPLDYAAPYFFYAPEPAKPDSFALASPCYESTSRLSGSRALGRCVFRAVRFVMAERERFELSLGVSPYYRISNPAPSATWVPLLIGTLRSLRTGVAGFFACFALALCARFFNLHKMLGWLAKRS